MLLQLRAKSAASTGSPTKLEEKIHLLTLLDVEEAKRTIVKKVQNQTFPEEFSD